MEVEDVFSFGSGRLSRLEPIRPSLRHLLTLCPWVCSLLIYAYFNSKETYRVRIYPDRFYTTGCELETSLLRLGRTCRQLLFETDEALYGKQEFNIEVFQSSLNCLRGFVKLNLSFLASVRTAHLKFEYDGHHSHRYGARMEEILRVLSESTELEVCTIDFVFPKSFSPQWRQYKTETEKQVDTLRHLATKEGVRDGKNAKDRELDFAKRAVEYFKTMW